MMEPNERFKDRLKRHARRFNFSFVPAAAATSNGRRSFVAYGARGESRSSALESSALALHGANATTAMVRTTVATVDLAAVLSARLPPLTPPRESESEAASAPSPEVAAAFAAASAYTSAWSSAAEDGGAGARGGAPGPTFGLLKLDVEGMEGELLPWLLSHGLLCRMRYIIIEWHLNRIKPPRRLAALGLRLSLHSLLEHGCATPPKAVYHDDFTANNFALPVPGLPRVAMEHASWAGRSRGGIDISQATTFYENADFAFFEQVSPHGSLTAYDYL